MGSLDGQLESLAHATGTGLAAKQTSGVPDTPQWTWQVPVPHDPQAAPGVEHGGVAGVSATMLLTHVSTASSITLASPVVVQQPFPSILEMVVLNFVSAAVRQA
jgi:hypothetical protein